MGFLDDGSDYSDRVSPSRHWRHLAFLKRVSTGDDPVISTQTASLSVCAWLDIRRATDNRMPVPAACTGPDGQMFYSWDREQHHLELEVIPEEPAFFFYRDRESGKTWSQDFEVGDKLSADVITKLRHFFVGLIAVLALAAIAGAIAFSGS